MADKNHTEAGRTFRAVGFHTDHIPDGEKNKGSVQFGRADFIISGMGLSAGVECKTGRSTDRQSWPFKEWSEKQRAWAERWTGMGNPYYLFLTVGTRVLKRPTEKHKHPRLSVLVPYADILRIEQTTDRKSLPYSWFANEINPYRLTWAGDNTWKIPSSHTFWQSWKEALDVIQRYCQLSA